MADKPAGSPSTGVQSPTPPVFEERDDFGLPIRKYVKPPVEDDKQSEATSPAPEMKEEAKTPSIPAGQEKAEVPVAKDNGVVDTDTEDETFEDARSKTTSEAATSPTKPTSDDRTSEPPEPARPAKDVMKPQNDDAIDTQETPKAVADPKDPMEVALPPGDGTATEDDSRKPTTPHGAEVDEAPKAHKRSDSAIGGKGPGMASQRNSLLNEVSAGEAPVGEFSHQTLPGKDKDNAKEEDEEEGWQEMPSYARYDMYNDDDKLIAREHDDEEEEKVQYSGLGGAGKGYTRVQMDEDAESATSMDDHTKYLFKGGGLGTSMTDGDDEEARTAVSQMQATKDLLTEGQRIAYVGVVRLEVAKMIKEREDMPTTKKVKKDTAMAAEATKMWGQKMMIRLYSHMDISEAEQIMIEQLAEHGVVPRDLTPALLTNARVQNPMAQSRISEELAESEDEDGDSKPEKEKSEKNDKASEARADQQKPDDGSVPPQYPEDDELPAQPPPPYEAVGGEDLPEVKTPSQMPKTEEIEIDLRWTVLCDLFLILIADSIYDARSRTLLERVGESLDVPNLDICRFEKRVTDALEMQQAAEKENWNEDEHMEARRKKALKRRYMMMGLATVGGGLVIGLSAGVLAPAIGAGLAAGFSTIGIGGTSAFLGGVGGAAIITTTAATSGGIVGVRAANRRTGAVKTFQYQPLHNNKRLNLVVTISGWLTGKMDDVRLPFSTVDPIVGDMYSVLWEPEMLRSMGDTINILATEVRDEGHTLA